MDSLKTNDQLLDEIRSLRLQLEEANDTIEAIRTGQIDALIVQGENGHQLYTLKTADQTYRVFIEKMTEGAVTLNRDGVIVYSNSRFASMIQVPLSKVVGSSFINFVSPQYKEDFASLFQNAWGEDCKGELLLSGKNRDISFQLSLTTLELDDGVSLSIILTDLTLQKETQRQLKSKNDQLEEINHALELSNNDLQQFASVASHDLQEPLRKIQMFSQLVKSKHYNELSTEAKKYLDKIIFSSNRMKVLIVDILTYSRLSQKNYEFEMTDLNVLLEELMEDFEIIVEEKKAEITIGELPSIEVNKGQMRQVFQNLVSNALKFSKAQETPRISITATVADETIADEEHGAVEKMCYLTIRDNGIGFDDKFAINIFSLFQRLHTKDRYEGTGIGLAIAKKIIDKHNGKIMAYSKEGEGAEFVLVLPVYQRKVSI